MPCAASSDLRENRQTAETLQPRMKPSDRDFAPKPVRALAARAKPR
jgi:hypothetical protein